MSFVKRFLFLIAAVVAAEGLRAETDDAFWGWNISGGGNFGFGLKTDLRMSPVNAVKCLPALHPAVGPTKQAAIDAARLERGGAAHSYGTSGAYIDPKSSLADDRYTVNWKLPDSAVRGTGGDRRFELDDGSWGEVVSSQQTQQEVGDGGDNAITYGASVELAHGLWSSEDGTWGVDFAFGLTWMRGNNCYKAGGVAATRSATVDRGDVTTTVGGGFFSLPWGVAEADDTWGNGTYDGSDYTRSAFELDLDSAQTVANTLSSQTYSDSMHVSARGDYEEWELAFMLRPWYDLTDWLCVHGTLGLGFTRSSFDYSMEAVCGGSTIYRSSEEFHEWRCYGIAGAGLLARFWDFDVSCDGLFRWCQDDMEINGKDVHGTLQKPWGVVRLGLSYNF